MEDLKGSKILVADDSVTLRKRILEFMKLEGFVTAEAATGEEVLQIIQEGKFQPDLILLDVIMPGTNGIDVCRQLRNNPDYEQIPILMLTVKTSAYDVSEAFKAGATDYVRKPFGAEELLLRIRVHLKNKLLLNELERVSTRVNDFMGIAAHDIRTPLTNILGLTQYSMTALEETGHDHPELKFALNNIETEGERILNLITAMLDLSVIQSGQFSLVKEEVDLNDFLPDVVKRAASLGLSKKVQFNLDCKLENSVISIDPYRIHQVLDNLISNAIRFSPQEGTVSLKVFTRDDQVCFEVIDEGPGLTQENIDKIFEPFFRDNSTEGHIENGVGLGLAIARKIIVEHEGSIGVTHELEKGASFYFLLPAGS